MPRGKVSVCKSWWARSKELSCSPATPIDRFCGRFFPQTNAIWRDSIFGTETGQPFYSSNEGSQWRSLANFLPPNLSVETALV